MKNQLCCGVAFARVCPSQEERLACAAVKAFVKDETFILVKEQNFWMNRLSNSFASYDCMYFIIFITISSVQASIYDCCKK